MKPTISQEDVLNMAGYLFGTVEDISMHKGIVMLATELLLPESHDSGNYDAAENLVRIAIEAHAG
jgi:hypothetical protein